jgi:hypothetical protein
MTFEVGGSISRLFQQFTSPTPDRKIREWKDTWRRGAQTQWSGRPAAANPHPAGSDRAAAWNAGWNWAARHSDRRQSGPARLAHPHRRSNDTLPRLISHAKTGAIGLSVLTVLGALWKSRRQRPT